MPQVFLVHQVFGHFGSLVDAHCVNRYRHSMESLRTSPDDQPVTKAKAAANWRFPLLLVLVLCAILVSGTMQTSRPRGETAATSPQLVPADEPTGETISLEIDFGNGAQWAFAAVPWSQGMTVQGALQHAARYSPGIQYTQSGEGAAGLLTSIAEIANEGSAGRNWIVFVNSVAIQQSFCLQELAPGDQVEWRFTRGGLDE